jgi:hypothetical protein
MDADSPAKTCNWLCARVGGSARNNEIANACIYSPELRPLLEKKVESNDRFLEIIRVFMRKVVSEFPKFLPQAYILYNPIFFETHENIDERTRLRPAGHQGVDRGEKASSHCIL